MDETAGALRIGPLDGRRHDRASFTCGTESLDVYLQTQAAQDVRRKANAVFALVAVPRYPLVSATPIGRLAVRATHHGQGLGGVLLARALRMAYQNADVVGSSMVVVDTIDDRAASFYRAHGFVPLPESPRLVLPMQTIARLL